MNDILSINEKTHNVAHSVKYHAQPLMLALRVAEGLVVGNLETWNIVDSSSVLQLRIPKQVIPFAQAGDTLCVNLCFFKAEVASKLVGVN